MVRAGRKKNPKKLWMCYSCDCLKETNSFSRNQLNKGSKSRRCRKCVDSSLQSSSGRLSAGQKRSLSASEKAEENEKRKAKRKREAEEKPLENTGGASADGASVPAAVVEPAPIPAEGGAPAAAVNWVRRLLFRTA